MSQRTLLAAAAAITSFILVVAVALAGRLTGGDAATSPTEATASFAEREAAYQATIAEANRRLELANQQLASQPTPPGPPAAGYAVSGEQAQTLALAAAPGATLTRPAELVRFQGTPAYEVVLDRGTIYIDAERATVLANGAGGEPVSPEQAAQIAQTYRGGGEVDEVERAHGGTYEVEFSDGATVYVDPAHGQIVYAQLDEYDEGEHDEDED